MIAPIKVKNESEEKITKTLAARFVYDKCMFIRNISMGFIFLLIFVGMGWGYIKIAFLAIALVIVIIVLVKNQQQIKYYQNKYGFLPDKLQSRLESLRKKDGKE